MSFSVGVNDLRDLLILLALGLVGPLTAMSQPCKRVSLKTPTRWGGNQVIGVDLRDEPVSSIHGVAGFSAESGGDDNILLQVYRRQHTDPLYRAPQPDDPAPIAACITGLTGAYRFDLPNGEYEIRASMNSGINVTHVYVTVKHRLHGSRAICIQMSPGT